MSKFLLENSKGEKDGVWTMLVVCFVVIMVKMLFGGTSLFDGALVIEALSGGTETATLGFWGSLVALYGQRRWTKAKYEGKEE